MLRIHAMHRALTKTRHNMPLYTVAYLLVVFWVGPQAASLLPPLLLLVVSLYRCVIIIWLYFWVGVGDSPIQPSSLQIFADSVLVGEYNFEAIRT